MRRRLMRVRLRGRAVPVAALVVALVAGAVAAVPAGAEADPVPSAAVPGMPVSLAQAGELALWGPNDFGQTTLPAALDGVAVTQLLTPTRSRLALTADGLVVGWGSHPERLDRVPKAVAAEKVAQIATGGNYAGAVTRDGRVLMWGKKVAGASPLDVPAGLSGVKQLAIAQYSAAALLNDGSVVAWGASGDGIGDTTWTPDMSPIAVPAGLKAASLAASSNMFYALTPQGTVEQWGRWTSSDRGQVPAAMTVPGRVKAITAFSDDRALALMDDNTLATFGYSRDALAEELEQLGPLADVVLLPNATDPGIFGSTVMTADRTLHSWMAHDTQCTDTPTEEDPEHQDCVVVQAWPGGPSEALNGRPIVQISTGSPGAYQASDAQEYIGGVIITKMLRGELPQVVGAPQVGSVLSGTPGTFSGSPDAVSSQWLVNGAPAGAGPQLTVTAAMVGKTITYASTATKAGESPASSSSAGVVVPAAAPPAPGATAVAAVSSSTKVVKVIAAKKGASVTVSGKVAASKSPAGKATVTIKKGKKSVVVKSVAVTASGAVKLVVKKFAQLVAKKTKAKGKKARSAYKGAYTVTIAYAGTSLVKASTGTKKFTIKK